LSDARLPRKKPFPFGIDALPVEVEVDVSAGLPGFSIVGLPGAAVQEARERVRVAISNSGYKFPTKKVAVNLARLDKPISPAW
jgi:magnesium chelatase family protein